MFKKATKQQSRLRLALIGPSGSGKTYTSLKLAKGLGKRIAVIDTERGSASKYSGDVAEFDVVELESFSPATYVKAIHEADAEGFDVLIIDSLSHAWMGKDGALEQVDKAAKRTQSGNSFGAWREVTPMHNQLVEAILQSRCHVIVTMRSKTEYVLEQNERGRAAPRKVGLAPVQRDGVEYEFDVVAMLDDEHNFIVSKTRCPALDKLIVREAGDEVAATLRAWLTDGAQVVSTCDELVAAFADVRDERQLEAALKRAGDKKPALSPSELRLVAHAAHAARELVDKAHAQRLAAGAASAPETSTTTTSEGQGAQA